MKDLDLLQEYRARLVDRYTAAELVELLDIDIEDVLDAFEERWQASALLQEEVGINAVH